MTYHPIVAEMVIVVTGLVGRPRKKNARRRASSAREEILDASSELFTKQGFVTTSTHEIAEAVGIRQASLYYHFASKADIFLTILKSTVEPLTELAERMSTLDTNPAMRLWALVATQTRLLLSTRWNLGRLYQLPAVISAEFREYHEVRKKLAEVYHKLAAEIIGEDDPRCELPYILAQGVIDMRPNDGTVPAPLSDTELPDIAIVLADAALAVLNAPLPENRVEHTLELLKADAD